MKGIRKLFFFLSELTKIGHGAEIPTWIFQHPSHALYVGTEVYSTLVLLCLLTVSLHAFHPNNIFTYYYPQLQIMSTVPTVVKNPFL